MCLPRRPTFVRTGIALGGHPHSLSSLDSLSFSVVKWCDRNLQVPRHIYGRSWPFLFCRYGTRAQVHLRTGSVVPLSGHDATKE